MLTKFQFHKFFLNKYIFILFISFSIFQQNYSAPIDTTLNLPLTSIDSENLNGKFIIVQLYNDMKYFMHQPSFYGVVGGIALAPKLLKKSFDNEQPEFTEMWKNSQLADGLFEMGEIFGDGQFAYAVSITSYGLGKMTKKKSMQSFGTDLFRAQTINALFVIGIKGVINRKRPNGGSYAYPSGHTSSTFASAGVIYKHFGKTYGIPSFLIAGYVGFSRLQENKHFLTDIISGGIIGSYVSLKLSNIEHTNKSVTISPYTKNNSTGLSLTMKF